jgi:hypothetical protein
MRRLRGGVLDAFITRELRARLQRLYRDFSILSEADLQAQTWRFLARFVHGRRDRTLRVHCNPYIPTAGIHPDIVIVRNGHPWVLMELKEKGRLTAHTIEKTRKRLVSARAKMRTKHRHAYIVSLSRRKSTPTPPAARRSASRFSTEMHICMQDILKADDFLRWEEEFKRRAGIG